MLLLLENQIQAYAWGSTDGIASIVGSAPTGGPEAELWVGTHPAAPSRVVGDPEGRDLGQVIAADPRRWLGPELAGRGLTALPFLLKVLAIGCPLSLQAHPSVDQARAGYAREDAAGLAVDAPDRNYRDDGAKPEALIALEPTWALCGFRPAAQAAGLLAGLEVRELDPVVEAMAAQGADGMRTVLAWLLRLEDPARTRVAAAVAAAVAHLHPGDRSDPWWWVRRLVAAFPGDPTAVAPLLLNVVALDPGGAVHLPAGNLHAYLEGAGIEIMAASDNVLRGGLTPKHVDVDELLAVLRFDAGVPTAPAVAEVGDRVRTYDAGEDAFALAVVEPGEPPVALDPRGPSLLLATGGPVTIVGPHASETIDHGGAAFLAAHSGPWTVSGPGRLWWATTGGALPR